MADAAPFAPRLRSTLLATLLTVVAAPSARAAEPAPPTAANDATFRSGLDQYGQGNYIGAIATWESLLATLGEERGYKVLYNLGLAYQAIGDVTRAIERYDAFVRQVGARGAPGAELASRADDARTRSGELQASHGAVHVRPPTRGGLVLTRVGSSEPRAAGYVVWLAPGNHTIELFVGTDHARSVVVAVERGRRVDIDTSPPEASPAPLAPSPAPERHDGPATPRSRSVEPLVVAGAIATVASVGAPIGLYFVATSKRNDASALGPGNSGYTDARASYETWRTAYFVSYALPVTLGVATATLYLLRPRGAGGEAQRASLAVGPGGAAIGGTF